MNASFTVVVVVAAASFVGVVAVVVFFVVAVVAAGVVGPGLLSWLLLPLLPLMCFQWWRQ